MIIYSIAKRKTVWAYLDGKKLVDVVQAALDNHVQCTLQPGYAATACASSFVHTYGYRIEDPWLNRDLLDAYRVLCQQISICTSIQGFRIS